MLDDFNAKRLKDMLDLFILKRFSDDGPLSLWGIQQRATPIYTLLDLFATRMGKPGLGSLLTTLQRLRRDGWLKAEGAGSELMYSLTVIGEQRVKEESARLDSMLSQFVEQGEMDKSFGKFLDRKSPLGPN